MNLVPLFEEALEFQDYNGTVLSDGKVAVYYIGRTRLADIYEDVAAEYPAENPRILNNLGMGPVYVNPAFDYELVVFDAYGSELFSVKKYLASKGEHSTANVVVTPSESIAVSAWTVGDVQVYMPYLTGQLGKVYEGIDPIVVNNQVDKISANHVPLGVQDPLYFVQDDEEGCIIGCSAQTEIPSALSSKWDEASDVVIANSAQWAEGTEYEAGNYISITDNTINVTGLTPVPADTASTGLVASVSADITAMIPDTSDMATQTWVNEQGFLTAHQSLDDLMSANLLEFSGSVITAYSGHKFAGEISGDAGDAEVNALVHSNSATWDNVTAKLDTTAFSDVSGTFLTAHQSLEGYATEQWVEDKGYLTGVEIPESAGWNNTTNVVSSHSAQWGASNPQIPVTSTSGISIFESGDKVYFNISADYAFADDITGKQDTLTFGYHDTAISSIDESAIYDTSAHARINTLAGRISDLSSNKLDTAIYAADSGTFLTALPSDLVYTADIANMATTGDLTGKQDITGMTAYATVDSLTAKQDAGNYLSATDSANFLLTSDSGNFYPMNENPSGYLTAHQSLADYQTTADMVNYQTTAGMTAYLTAVPDTYLQNTDLTIVDGKISEISGVPLSAGDELPSGILMESGLGYNAVQEISGINGSAIAQYGHEAQWLVHDDTLVHASNSAQYALGVNLSAVAQLLGVDETVLWETNELLYTENSAVNLSENYKNFKEIDVYYQSPQDDSYYKSKSLNVYRIDTNRIDGNTFSIGGNYILSNDWWVKWMLLLSANTAGTSITITNAHNDWASKAYSNNINDYSNDAARAAGGIYKIVGIGRKA